MRPLIAKVLNFLAWLQLLGWLAFLWFIEKAETLTGLQTWVLAIGAGIAALALFATLQRLADRVEEGGEQ
jgi:hypothetical protein